MMATTTITLEADTRERLGHLQLELRRHRSRSVSADEAVQYLLNALEELPAETRTRLALSQFQPPEATDT